MIHTFICIIQRLNIYVCLSSTHRANIFLDFTFLWCYVIYPVKVFQDSTACRYMYAWWVPFIQLCNNRN